MASGLWTALQKDNSEMSSSRWGFPTGWPNWRSFHILTGKGPHMMHKGGSGTTTQIKTKWSCTGGSGSKAGYKTHARDWKKGGLSM
eukprot:10966841-Prorocentrum_lima.AAC.1